MTDFID